jgi:hypothetical protein
MQPSHQGMRSGARSDLVCVVIGDLQIVQQQSTSKRRAVVVLSDHSPQILSDRRRCPSAATSGLAS